MDEQTGLTQVGNQDYRHKLDGVMRRLLEMDEESIRKRVSQGQQRLTRLKKQVAQEVDLALPEDLARRAVDVTPEISAREVEALRSRLLRLRERELLPDRIVAAVVPDLLPRVCVPAIINFTGNRQDLEGLGLQVRTQAQDVFTVVGTLQQLRDLAAQPACQRLRAPRMFFPVVEDASTQAEIADVHNPRPLNPNGYQGNGILIGIIDTALEVTHHTFRNPGGAHGTRLLYYWVQSPYTRTATGRYTLANLLTLPGQDPDAWSAAAAAGTRPDFSGLNYGRLYTQAAIDTAIGLANPYGTGNNQICCEPWYQITAFGIDSEHGTHCAGIAAGNGREANWATVPTHVGAAPQATIIYVCTRLLSADTGRDGTWEDAILDGIDFIFRAAAFHNMPVVISISQATNLGPHNGASDLDQAIDNLLNSFFDRSVVIAAGNDNVGGHDVKVDRDADPGGGLHNIRMFFEDALSGNVYTIDLRNPHAAQSADYHVYTGSRHLYLDWHAVLPTERQRPQRGYAAHCTQRPPDRGSIHACSADPVHYLR